MFMSSSCAFWLSITLHQPEAKGSELVPEILQAEHVRRPKGRWLVPRRQAHGAFVEVGLWPRPRKDCDQGPRETLHGRGHQDFQVLPDPTWKLRKLACWSPNATSAQPCTLKAWCVQAIQVFDRRSVEMALACH